MNSKLFLVVLYAIYAPLVKSTSQEELAAWFKENSEIFVILKHWNELPLVSTAWKRIKDTPAIATSRNTIKKGFDSFITFCDCNKRSSSSLPQSSPANDVGCSSKNCSTQVTRTPEIISADEVKRNTALEERVNQLEATLQRFNESFQRSQIVSKTSSEMKSVIDSEALKKPINISASDLSAFIENHKEEQRWIRSQLIPLNYLFEKLKTIEDDVKEIQRALEIKKKAGSPNTPNLSLDQIYNISNEALSDLNVRVQFAEMLGKNLSTDVLSIDEKVDSLRQEFNSTKAQVTDLSVKLIELNAKVSSSANATDEEYCPEKLDEMTPCSEVEESCYCFSKHQKNWTAALDYCLSKNMYLLSLETQKETEYLLNYINQSDLPKDFYWTSGSDAGVEGNWVWTASETNVSYTNWRSQQPDGGIKENCLYLHGRDDFKWGDWLCSLSQYFICEW